MLDPNGNSLSYSSLEQGVEILRARLKHAGIESGDRIGIYMPKSIGAIVSIFASLKADAAYIPLDSAAPPERCAYILVDCTMKAAVVSEPLVAALRSKIPDGVVTDIEALEGSTAYGYELSLLHFDWARGAAETSSFLPKRLAYILYTSGSTGRPKGVMHTHDSALSFVDWCSETFQPTSADRFSSHAPFHFDLSILDIFLPIKHGATIVLVPDDIAKHPARLAQLISEERLTSWYSTPSILRLLIEYGQLDRLDFSNLRTVLFAGEVFPVKYLKALQQHWRGPRYYNLYGPTETNVCTFHEAPGLLGDDVTEPLPIGKACSGDRLRVVDEAGCDVPPGSEGELIASGGSVMPGYWNLPERNAEAFLTDGDGVRWYRTGDIVREDPEVGYIYLGRRDRMVKRRGYRIELGDIESALYRHDDVSEAAVVATPDDESGVRITAFLCWSGANRPSQIAMKRYCAQRLPNYMIPDEFTVLGALPKTSTDKIDYQGLKGLR